MDRSNEYFSELFQHNHAVSDNKPWLHIPIWAQYQDACSEFLATTGKLTRPTNLKEQREAKYSSLTSSTASYY